MCDFYTLARWSDGEMTRRRRGSANGRQVLRAFACVVLPSLRILPAERASYERLIRARVRAVERARLLVRWSETGRFLVSDGWDCIRFISIASLGDWQRYREALDKAGAWDAIDRLVLARKTTIVLQAPTVSVR